MAFGLSNEVVTRIVRVFESSHKVQRVLLFGSRSLGRHREGSDIDLALEGDFDFNDILEFRIKLEDLMLPYSFDLVELTESLDPSLREHILRAGVVIFDRRTNK